MVEIDTIFLYKHEDGNWSDHADDFHNRGFLFGDGLFETMVYWQGKLRFSNSHFSRLNEGMRVLGLSGHNLSTVDQLETLLNEIWGDKKSLRVRWNVYRSGMGKYTPEVNQVLESLQVQSFHPAPKLKKSAFFSQEIHIQKSPWSHCKTLNALQYVMANMERKNRGYDEIILTTPEGIISEAGSSNLFWIKNGQYFSPSLDAGCISGIGREQVLFYLKENQIPFSEGFFSKENLISADQILTSNVTGISYIESVENKRFDTNRNTDLDSIFEF
jgi:branched-subunit amino acid aminotransferase/4-amino-4-deoxychorismate lyase